MANAQKIFFLGTAVKITSTINVATVTSAKITIDNPSEQVMIDNVEMTKDADGIYHYIYQSASTDDEGTYVATISMVYGGYTSVEQVAFTLEEQV